MNETSKELVTVEDEGPKLGIFDDIPSDEYHFGKGISKSGLDIINRSPAHYITNKQHPRPPTDALDIGRAFHSLVLEPDVFSLEFICEPDDAPRRPTQPQLDAVKKSDKARASIEYWQHWDAENIGKTVIKSKPGANKFWKPGDWATIHNMRDAIMSHPMASILCNHDDGKAEQTIYWIDELTFKLCKCRPDFDNQAHNVIVDLKSTLDASYTEFAKSVGKWRYQVQDSFYTDGMRSAGRKIAAFVFIAVEKDPPYGVGVYVLDAEDKRIGRTMYQNDLDVYKTCHDADEWPCYSTDIRNLETPPWTKRGKIS